MQLAELEDELEGNAASGADVENVDDALVDAAEDSDAPANEYTGETQAEQGQDPETIADNRTEEIMSETECY